MASLVFNPLSNYTNLGVISSSSGDRLTRRQYCYAPNFTRKLSPRLRICRKAPISPKLCYTNRVNLILPCCSTPDTHLFDDDSSSSSKEPHINIQLPRRSLLVQFTCDACGERTKRLINRLAYERGTVFVQCAGCLQHHKLIDNLGLVVEYDFRNGTDQD